jgi:hypothetical protein
MKDWKSNTTGGDQKIWITSFLTLPDWGQSGFVKKGDEGMVYVSRKKTYQGRGILNFQTKGGLVARS